MDLSNLMLVTRLTSCLWAAQSEANAEMAAILAQVAKSIGLEWNTPACLECLRLDNWFLVSEHDT